MTKKFYWQGNVAKSRIIDEILARSLEINPVTVFDFGCGDGGDWVQILDDHPCLRLIGYEPYVPSLRSARERLRGRRAEIFGGNEIWNLNHQVQYIVSFSVFEHVVRREEFLNHAKRILAPEGLFYLNYDDGHFRNSIDVSRPMTWLPVLRAWGRTAVSRPLAAVGLRSHYQRRVTAEDADRLVAESGFHIERVDYHNLISLKDLAKSIPENLQQHYASWWLETEKYLNEKFRSQIGDKQLGDITNLWKQMPSRTLCLSHR